MTECSNALDLEKKRIFFRPPLSAAETPEATGPRQNEPSEMEEAARRKVRRFMSGKIRGVELSEARDMKSREIPGPDRIPHSVLASLCRPAIGPRMSAGNLLLVDNSNSFT